MKTIDSCNLCSDSQHCCLSTDVILHGLSGLAQIVWHRKVRSQLNSFSIQAQQAFSASEAPDFRKCPCAVRQNPAMLLS